MPSTVTHSYFMLDIYEKLPIQRRYFLKNCIDKMCLFAQSTDPFNFYLSKNIRKSKKVRSFSSYFHSHKCGEYLITLINYIKYNYHTKNPEVMAFLYGMISHYILDSKTHPFICYNTGLFDKDKKETYKYNNLHHIHENLIDQYFIKIKEKCKPYLSKSYYKIFNFEKPSKELIEVINFSFKETFGIDDYYKKWKKSVENMKICFKYLRHDRFNIKNKVYNIIDKITSKKAFKLSFLSYHYTNKNINFLNTNHEKWNFPTDNRKKYTSSFINIYLDALNNAISIIKEVDNYIYRNKKVNLKKLLKNNSYGTGIDLSKNQNMKYFKF